MEDRSLSGRRAPRPTDVSPSDRRKLRPTGDVTRIGVVGLGYWGPNLARNVEQVAGAELAWCCDERDEVRERLAAKHPRTRFTAQLDDLLADGELDAIVLA
ncbi:MAG TPA: Gfo/Idh/MocA family oxidoreductase, partial [Solirubrobacteraceae bacterium]